MLCFNIRREHFSIYSSNFFLDIEKAMFSFNQGANFAKSHTMNSFV